MASRDRLAAAVIGRGRHEFILVRGLITAPERGYVARHDGCGPGADRAAERSPDTRLAAC